VQKIIPWVYYVSPMGREVVVSELRKIALNASEREHLDRTLQRIARSESIAGDVDYLGREMWEVRVRLERRILRLLYFEEVDPPLRVVVLAAIKKTPKTPSAWINLGLSRKNMWQSIDE
jgi:phage-related protein